jgi:LEA14-like dessication related protein
MTLKFFSFDGVFICCFKSAIVLQVITLSSLLSGCAVLQPIVGWFVTRPDVELVGVGLSRSSMTAVNLALDVEVKNPNGFDLRFSRMRYDISAEGIHLASGAFDEGINVPSRGQAVISLPVRVEADGVARLIYKLMRSSADVPAIMRATADFGSPFGTFEVKFEDSHPIQGFGS